MEKKDITSLADIQLLVDTFYGRVREDALIGPIFNNLLASRWEDHLKKMYSFWQTILLEKHTYFGSPFPPHAAMSLTNLHFDAWLKLWYSTVQEFFEGEKADEAIHRGDKMATMFLSKITYFNNLNTKPLI